MGDPKRQRRKYETPRYPWSRELLDAELKLIGEYGLRNKRELWRHHTMLSKYRNMARSLLGKSSEERAGVEKQFLNKLYDLGIVSQNATLDDVLDLSIEDILERRLQTLVFRRGLAKSSQQARQLVTHGHISIGERRLTSPSYIVPREEESLMAHSPNSPLANVNHPLRKGVPSTPLPEVSASKRVEVRSKGRES